MLANFTYLSSVEHPSVAKHQYADHPKLPEVVSRDVNASSTNFWPLHPDSTLTELTLKKLPLAKWISTRLNFYCSSILQMGWSRLSALACHALKGFRVWASSRPISMQP